MRIPLVPLHEKVRTMASTDVLFRPSRIGSMELANRMVTPSMMRSLPAGILGRRMPPTALG